MLNKLRGFGVPPNWQTMYERTERDEQTLSAAGFEELDSHWFRYRESDLYIAMPGNSYCADPSFDQDWGVYENDEATDVAALVKACDTLEEAITLCMRLDMATRGWEAIVNNLNR